MSLLEFQVIAVDWMPPTLGVFGDPPLEVMFDVVKIHLDQILQPAYNNDYFVIFDVLCLDGYGQQAMDLRDVKAGDLLLVNSQTSQVLGVSTFVVEQYAQYIGG
jgi:hypothetical protein